MNPLMPRSIRHFLCLSALIFGSTYCHGTEQVPDKLIHGNQTNDLYATPLEQLFTADNPKPRSLRPVSTACWRGYEATWRIHNDTLQLFLLKECHTENAIPLRRFFPDAKEGTPIDATWYTGTVRSGSGERVYEKVTHRNQREHEQFFRIEQGKVISVSKENPVTLKVVAYNIKHGRGMDGKVDLKRIAEVLKRTEADLIALQEIDKNCTRSGKVDIAKELGTMLGMEHRFAKFMDYQGGEYGLAILSRFPIVASTRHPLPDGAEPRCALEVQVRPPNLYAISFVCIHNDWTDDAIRVKQVRALMEAIPFSPGRRLLLAGDFNAKRSEASMRLLSDAGWNILEKKGAANTFPSDVPKTEIDFLVLRGFEVRSAEHRVIDERIASDHRPIEATFRLRWRD